MDASRPRLRSRRGRAGGLLRRAIAAGAIAGWAVVAWPQDGPRFDVSGYRIEGDNPIGEARAQAVLAPFIGASIGLDRLQAAAEAFERALHEAGFGFFRVILPPQDTGSVVALKVLAFTLGRVDVKSAMFFSEANVRASLPALRDGSSPNTLQLARDLALANENPSKRVVAAFRPGEKPDTVDASLEVADSRPLAGFAQLANTGTVATGMTRLTFGATHANLFDRDHQLTATYTVSPERLSRVRQWGMFYRAPVYGAGGMVSGYWTESNVQSGSAAGVAITGGGRFAGLQYTQYFAPRGDYRDYLTVSFDDKQFDNSVLVAGINAGTCNRIASRPISASYSGRFEGANLTLSFNADLARNLPGGPHNAQADYDRCNPPADASRNLSAAWAILRAGADIGWRIAGDWLLAGRVRVQHAPQALIAGEKFGVGGAQSVRALGERALAGDSGVSGSVELWFPPWWQGARWLAFVDHGRVRSIHPPPGALVYDAVSSAGFGLRWQYQSSVSLALDYGVVVQGFAPNANVTGVANVRGHDRLHLNMLVRF
ncbi:MAG: ShlB/FhaC/HecB family hemolysin secretion/activation protein [Burkholderiales bacterium]|nr:ShlB/FhaC/HecB family hemolysin secretion/activation protein [Burkholderiales bacterium]